MSVGYSPDGKHRRRTVRGRTKTELRDKLRGLREDIASGVKTPAAYSVQQTVDEWLGSGLDGRPVATVAKYRHVPKPSLELIGHAPLRELTAHDVRAALTCGRLATWSGAGLAHVCRCACKPGFALRKPARSPGNTSI